MTREIVVEGSTQEIVQKIAKIPGHILKAILVVEETRPTDSKGHQSTSFAQATPSPNEDAWTQNFRRWAANHRSLHSPIDDSRESVYKDRLE